MYHLFSSVSSKVISFFKSTNEEPKRDAPGEFIQLKHGETHYLLKKPTKENNSTINTEKELVVMLHGASVFSFIWNRFAQWFLSAGYPVFMFDFYGHGYSDCPSNIEYSIPLFVEQTEEIMGKLSVFEEYTNILIIGHRLIGSHIAAKHKNKVSKVVLLNAAGIPVNFSLNNFMPSLLRIVQETIRRTTCLDHIVHAIGKVVSVHGNYTSIQHDDVSLLALTLDEDRKIQSPHSKWIDRPIPAKILTNDSLRFVKSINFLCQSWILQSRITTRSNVLLSILRNCKLLDGEYSNIFLDIDVPTLVVWGTCDTLLPKSLVEGWKQHIPHAEILFVEEADHAPFLQKPKVIFDAILKFHTEGTTKKEEII